MENETQRPDTQEERDAYQWASSQQGFGGSYQEWLSMPDTERAEYEDGAAGLPTA